MTDNFLEEKKYLKIKVANKKGYDEAYEGDSVNMEYPSSTTRRGRVGGGTTTIYLASGDVIEYDGKTVKKIP